MKLSKGLVVVLALAALVGGVSERAFGLGSETSSGTWFDQYLEPHAKGTELRGTLTLHYLLDDSSTISCETTEDGADLPNATLYVFLRLKKEKDPQIYAFSTKKRVCVIDLTGQKAAVDTFIRNCVLTTVFPEPVPDTVEIALKSVSNVVTEETTPVTGESCSDLDNSDEFLPPMFTMLDLVIGGRNRRNPVITVTIPGTEPSRGGARTPIRLSMLWTQEFLKHVGAGMSPAPRDESIVLGRRVGTASSCPRGLLRTLLHVKVPGSDRDPTARHSGGSQAGIQS
ncbi:MAG: hypothetical protein AB9873_16540 [Syntrophobacteraceae bacterium]